MADAFTVVTVGNSECGLVKFTPSRRIFASVGAVWGVTLSARRPSATKISTLRGAAGFGAAEAGRAQANARAAVASDQSFIDFLSRSPIYLPNATIPAASLDRGQPSRHIAPFPEEIRLVSWQSLSLAQTGRHCGHLRQSASGRCRSPSHHFRLGEPAARPRWATVSRSA